MANGSDPTPSSTSLKTFLVCGMTGAGKSTFINTVTGAQLSVSDRIDSDTVDVIETGIPLIKVGNEYIQLVDTPGFGDSREDDEVVILERVTTWLVARYMSKVPVTGVIFLRPITEVRVNRLEKSLMMMFKDLCGENSLDHIFLLTSRWPSELSDKYEGRERDILSRDDMFGSNGDKQVQVRRLKDAYTPEDARHVVESCAGLASVTFQIQREISDEKKSLAETQAGMRIGADWDQKLSGLEEQAKQASEYADAEKRRLEEAEAAKRRLDEEAAKAAEETRRLAEAEKEAQRQAEIAKARMEKERLEAEARARKAEAEMRAAQKAAEEARALQEKQRAEEERRMQQARAEAEAARQRAERAAAEATRLREAEQRARWEREQQQQHQGGCLVM